jgi:hypothetical protein
MWVIATDGTIVNLDNACSVASEGGAVVAQMVNGETITLYPATTGAGSLLESLQRAFVFEYHAIDLHDPLPDPGEPDRLLVSSRMRHED